MTLIDFTVRKKAQEVCQRLEARYGTTISSRRLPPIDELILTILSQNTTDKNAERAFEKLKSSFSTWNEMLEAGETQIAELIRSSGAFRVKAHRIVRALNEIRERVGILDFSFLEDLPLEAAKNWLTSLYGVGPKTAAIILLFSFRRPILPVDTHVFRITTRLGLIPVGTPLAKAHILLGETIPSDCVFTLNHNLVRHGREICRALNPRCAICFLDDICDKQAL